MLAGCLIHFFFVAGAAAASRPGSPWSPLSPFGPAGPCAPGGPGGPGGPSKQPASVNAAVNAAISPKGRIQHLITVLTLADSRSTRALHRSPLVHSGGLSRRCLFAPRPTHVCSFSCTFEGGGPMGDTLDQDVHALKEFLGKAWRYLASPSLSRFQRQEMRNQMRLTEDQPNEADRGNSSHCSQKHSYT